LLARLSINDAIGLYQGQHILDFPYGCTIKTHTGVEFGHPFHKHRIVVAFNGVEGRHKGEMVTPEIKLLFEGRTGDDKKRGQVVMGPKKIFLEVYRFCVLSRRGEKCRETSEFFSHPYSNGHH